MATYAISDIHGAYDEFVRLLRKINFRLDGSDTLYLLGDYIDWGEQPLKTLLLVKQLDETYDFVHCVPGNHEVMFLQTIEAGYDGCHSSDAVDLWLYANHGIQTWNEYCDLSDDQARELAGWLRTRRLSYTARVGGFSFMLAHAYPYYYDLAYTPEEERRCRQNAVWHRMLLRENPFDGYRGQEHYDCLICGHTISDTYHAASRADGLESSLPLQPAGNRIFFGEHFIDIDCGAKCMGLDPRAGQAALSAVMRAQLSALRLEDMEEFYVRHLPALVNNPGQILPDSVQSMQARVSRYVRGLQMQLFER